MINTMNRVSSFLTTSSQWDEYLRGWILLLEAGDSIFWNLLMLSAFIVRSLALIVLLYSLGSRLWWDSYESTKRAIISIIVLILVTMPFLLSGYPIFYPEFLPP